MKAALPDLIKRLAEASLMGANVIPWGCPVPSFGNLTRSEVATVGLNPSNREFVDESGNELDGPCRRFHTLRSLGLERWSDAEPHHFDLIADSCSNYFSLNPYNRWFKRLDYIISGTRASYYWPDANACHLDLIPYATACKWTELSQRQRSSLLTAGRDSLGLLVRDSPVRILVLNGNSVVRQFEEIADMQLDRMTMDGWSLARRSQAEVMGISYRGTVRRLCGVELGRDVLVLGFNHNIQSSFGVTKAVVEGIRRWITESAKQTP
jgi:hypothetical protein